MFRLVQIIWKRKCQLSQSFQLSTHGENFIIFKLKKKKDPDIGIDGFDKQIRYSQETSYIPRNKIMESTKISLYN